MKTEPNMSRRFFLSIASLALVFTSLPLMAGKPTGGGGGSVPAGTIYYTWLSASSLTQPAVDRGDWTMKADGTSKVLRPYQGDTSTGARLSHQPHYGQRWLLERRFDLVTAEYSLYAVSESGSLSVLLADGSSLGGAYLTSSIWGKDDSFVSIVARDTGAFAQLYRAAVTFDANGIPALTSTWEWVVSGERLGYSDITNHDWSPDGTQVVLCFYSGSSQAYIKIRDLTTQTTRLLTGDGWNPCWSPDGLWIAFTPFNSALCIIHPDGSGFASIGNKSGGVDTARDWSPDGQHILFARYLYKSVKGGTGENTYDVMRMPATGGNPANHTSDIDGQAIPLWWR